MLRDFLEAHIRIRQMRRVLREEFEPPLVRLVEWLNERLKADE